MSLRNADPRVLKSQLDVIAAIDRSSWVVTPLWSIALALMVSDLGWQVMGAVPWREALLFPLIVTAASFLAYGFYAVYRSENSVEPARLGRWAQRFLCAQIAISIAWGLLPWLLWEPGNTTNHLFLLIAIATTMASLLISRLGSMTMLVGGMGPAMLMTSARFMSEGSLLGSIFAMLIPIYGVHLYIDGKRFIHQLEADVRLRLEVEDMAALLAAARDEAQAKRHEAEAANAAKSAFLANMSHELRTPLNAILGFSEIIGHQVLGPGALERYSGYARDIHHSGAHLLALINDLLDVAKIEAGKMEIDPRPFDPREVMDSIGRIMGSRAAAGKLQLRLEAPPDIPLLVADERALKQMLLNLVSNAVKFTPPGGQVTLACSAAADGGMLFCISDDGPGIAPEKLARIFQPFNQIDNRFDREAGGTGLGLALARGLVELHGGRVWLESEPGHGTRACLYFPATIPAGQGRQTA